MNRFFKTLLLALCITSLQFTIGCSQQSSQEVASAEQERVALKIGTLSTFEPVIPWIEEEMKELGYDIEHIVFDGHTLPATALGNKEIDGLFHNHKPWIETFNSLNSTNLVVPEPYITYGPLAIYSLKHDSVEDIPQNAQFALMGDPTNMERSLIILQDVGLITLGDKTGEFYSIIDIEENPKNIRILETESATTVRSIEDVDAVIVYAHRMMQASLDPTSYIYADPESANYPQSLVVNEGNENEQWVIDFLAITQTESFRDKFNEYYQGSYILYE